jgi:hypothetical protein
VAVSSSTLGQQILLPIIWRKVPSARISSSPGDGDIGEQSLNSAIAAINFVLQNYLVVLIEDHLEVGQSGLEINKVKGHGALVEIEC